MFLLKLRNNCFLSSISLFYVQRISALASHSSTSSHHPLVTEADNGLKVNQDPVVAAGNGSINHEADSSKIASLPQSGCHIVRNTQYAQPRMAKPSGLWMPSPSLGFFTLVFQPCLHQQ